MKRNANQSEQSRALIVEDDTWSRKLIRQVLFDDDIRSDQVRNGWEALVRLESRPYDFILLDLMLPSVNGFRVLEFLKECLRNNLERVIVITAMPLETVRRLAPEFSGVIISKPFDVVQLRNAIRQIARH